MPHLAGKHGNLSAMVGVVSDEISEKADCVWTKTFDVAVGGDGSAQNYAESFAALFHCPQSLRRSRAVGGEGANVFCMARSRKLKFTHRTRPRNLLRRSSLLHKLGGLARGLLGFVPGRVFSSYSLIPED